MQQGLAAGKLLKKEILQKAQTAYRLKDGSLTGYGYGWFIKTSGSARSIEHEGGLPGFLANEIYFPDQDILSLRYTIPKLRPWANCPWLSPVPL